MPVSVPNPYSGQDDETCSVSFQAQQAMAGTVGSAQTEADYNKSKLLGEWGVIKAKLAKKHIPNGTKLLTYENSISKSRGYLYVKDGKLHKRAYFQDGKQTDVVVDPQLGENMISSQITVVSIPQAVSPKPKAEPVKVVYGDKGYQQSDKPNYADGEIIAVTGSGKYIKMNKSSYKLEVWDKDTSGNYFNLQSSTLLSNAMDDDDTWYKPDGKDATSNATPKAAQPTKAPPPTFVAAPTPTAPVNAGSGSVGSMSHEDVSAMFVKVKDDLAKEQGLNIKGANPALDEEVYKAIGDATGYTPAEVKAKIDAYKAAGNKLSALKKKVLAGTKKVPVIAKDPPKAGPTPPPAPTVSAIPLVNNNPTKKEALDKLASFGQSANGYVTGGTSALGLKPAGHNGFGINNLTDKLAEQAGVPLTNIKTLSEQFGEDFVVDAGEDLYTQQTWVFSAVVKKYINNPGDGSVLAVRKEGKLIVIDGNHRAAAAKLTNTPVKVRVLDLDKPFVKKGGADPKPNGVPTVATPTVVNAVKVEVKKVVNADPGKVYSDEDVSAAYIIAKDKAVAASNGKFTLYSKSDELDAIIFGEVQAKTGLDKTKAQQAIANYLATGKKLSQLKKSLAKQGAFKPEADTLKKGGTGAAASPAAKAKDVDAKADAGYTPTPTPAAGTPPVDTGKPMPKAAGQQAREAGDITGINAPTKSLVYSTFKGQGSLSYLTSSNEQTYEALVKTQAAMKSSANQELSLLQILRIIDEEGAKKFKAANGKLFEKKTATWLTTPEGTAFIKKKEKDLAEQAEKAAKQAKLKAEAEEAAKKLMANQPPLPADSAQYEGWSLDKAKRVSQTWLDAKPWTAKEKRDLVHYTGSSYTEMNGYLRGLKSSISDRSKSAIDGAKAGMRPTTEPILVKRGTGLNQFQSIGVGRGDATAVWGITGKTFTDEGFLSTSAGGTAAFGGEARLEIECPVGTPMAYVAPISNYPGENEMLLQAGMKYKVLNVRKEGNTFVVRVRVVDWPGKKD